MPDDRPPAAPLPESLQRQLESFRRRLWRTKIAEALLAGLFGLLLSFLFVFALDRFWSTPPLLRLAILLGGSSLMAVFAPLRLHRWVWRHRHADQLARLIARRHPGLGDRLLGAIDLQHAENDDTMSPRLRAAAMEAVAAEAARRQLDDSLPPSLHRRWTFGVAVLAAVVFVALALVPNAGLNSLQRWLLPLSSTPRYTFTVLERLPVELPVPQGEAFTLEVRLAPDTVWRPALSTARYGRQEPVTATLGENLYRFEFPGQQDPATVRLDIGDARPSLTILPSLRPAIRRTVAEVDFPDYLQLENRVGDLGSGVVTAVAGSQLRLSIEATRPLESAAFRLGENGDARPMTVRETFASTPFFPLEAGAREIPMTWSDALGLAGAEGFSVRVEAVPDEAPGTYLQGLPSQLAILPEETIDVLVSASDDFGIREYGLAWEGEFTRPTDQSPASGSLRLETGGPDLAHAESPAAFSPAALGIAPQKLMLRSYVEDYLPDRGRIYSRPVTLYVLTRDEHAQMLKNRFDRAVGRLEDLARRERNLFEENQRLERLDPAELRAPENQKRLGRQQQAQQDQTDEMKRLAEEMEKLLQDSARNGTLDKETLRRMAETLDSMNELSKEGMPKVPQNLGEAQDPRRTDGSAAERVDEAVEQQAENLEKLRETIERANDANQRFEASTFVNRLKKSASEELAIARALLDASEDFGLRREQLDPADLGNLDEIIRQQSDTASDVRWIQEDLGHFFTRTDSAVYREILDEMILSEIDLGLEDVRLRLQRNHGFTAAQGAMKWSEKLAEWAKRLGGDDKGGSGGGGGGGGGGGEDEDFEFMLRVMQLVQKEQDLRARTRALETLRRSTEPEP